MTWGKGASYVTLVDELGRMDGNDFTEVSSTTEV